MEFDRASLNMKKRERTRIKIRAPRAEGRIARVRKRTRAHQTTCAGKHGSVNTCHALTRLEARSEPGREKSPRNGGRRKEEEGKEWEEEEEQEKEEEERRKEKETGWRIERKKARDFQAWHQPEKAF